MPLSAIEQFLEEKRVLSMKRSMNSSFLAALRRLECQLRAENDAAIIEQECKRVTRLSSVQVREELLAHASPMRTVVPVQSTSIH